MHDSKRVPHPRRTCPRDGHRLIEEPLDPLGRHVVVDACALCHGMFLDKGEVAVWTGDKILQKALVNLPLSDDSKLPCPGCGGEMHLREAGPLHLDVCTSCHGVWMDAGELDALEDLDPAELDVGGGWPALHERVLGRLWRRVGAQEA